MRHVAVVAVMRSDGLLLVKKGKSKAWTLPMVELGPEEPAEPKLRHEVDEIVGQAGSRSFKHFKRIDCLAPDNGEKISADVYFLDLGITYAFQPPTDAVMWCYNPAYYVLSDIAWKTIQLLVYEKRLPLSL